MENNITGKIHESTGAKPLYSEETQRSLFKKKSQFSAKSVLKK
jgi:hypothetical protein